MTPTLEILLALLAPTIALLIYLINLLLRLTQDISALGSRVAVTETNVKLLLQWVACLNGEMSNKKEFREFLDKLKKVNKENFCDE